MLENLKALEEFTPEPIACVLSRLVANLKHSQGDADAISDAFKPIQTNILVCELGGSFVRECFAN